MKYLTIAALCASLAMAAPADSQEATADTFFPDRAGYYECYPYYYRTHGSDGNVISNIFNAAACAVDDFVGDGQSYCGGAAPPPAPGSCRPPVDNNSYQYSYTYTYTTNEDGSLNLNIRPDNNARGSCQYVVPHKDPVALQQIISQYGTECARGFRAYQN
ncbi:hypothetical protein QQS21_000470 [Conoideocrella luteorostrata]|uniref:Uncharacterized protein n=1 Tax=Conoideocrella luteorostrata TaxID=1105319 RepID=A0AAJ0D129_9HYPO|nr:hypothetical protein QQS21_000470 [Conoideocrella luteorostrata]